ncbi:KAP family P-loop NTPase fold protein [Poritiphilus flavus]|uniref:KAP NTPase domain-containing protein n=1 Tax=Poritiphilus flavus TaxID=2697053 RepID=A0A6L9E6M6_9FLAO|nr:P-loop NTPase fold protein [Poritiphilus flavus]NAS10375.1 hypothetical protein [Poritiphilus flavus]
MALLNNLPIEKLTSETDYLGIIEKADLIREVLLDNKEQFSELKMFALYGEWGSGKSTLMKYLQNKLKENFNTFFFDTWEYETDRNLPYSLLEFITSRSESAMDALGNELVGIGEKLLKGFGKSIKISFPGLTINGKYLIETLESEKDQTFFQLKKGFSTEFQRFEDKLQANNGLLYNIVFIDDLDRCEPENVLNLLSALKLFFTYGKRTIFFCGIDKKAVQEAVKTKYGDIIKANEYLEKIFDLSFTMPEHENVQKLINVYFDARTINIGSFEGRLNEKIKEFFGILRFTNPRRLKKVLNKYHLLCTFKHIDENQEYNIIPNIFIKGSSEGNFLETILTLYFLIINEFHKDKLDAFYNLELKKINFGNAVEAEARIRKTQNTLSEINAVQSFLPQGRFNIGLKGISNVVLENQQNRQEKTRTFMKIFSPHNPDYLKNAAFANSLNFKKHYLIGKKEIDYFLAEYLISHVDNIVLGDNTISDYLISDFGKMLKTYL